ncbi:unnamed protein product [Mytilus edulis]|uniref:Death domain-containing protein n=1 Tax=Mytilus edulis TaxID=6550 RepID=A0A8S3T1A8_MYTED|nr:unnamed protein product [Mytilus edulis]
MAKMYVYCFLLLLFKCSVALEANYHDIIQNSFQILKGYSQHNNQTVLFQDINAMNKALNVRTILDNLQTFSDELDKFSELSDSTSVLIGNTTNIHDFNVTSTLNQNTYINSLPTTVYATHEQGDTTLAKETPTVSVTTKSMPTTVLPVNVTASNSPVTASTIPPLPKVNALCLNHTQSVLAGLFGGKQWAMQMLDALGKPPAGLLSGKIAWLGDYDECIGISAEEFNGEYCLAKFYVTSLTNPVLNESKRNGNPSRAMCAEYLLHFRYKKSVQFRIVIGILVGLAIIATTYDVVIQHMSKPKKNSWDLSDAHATTYDSAGNGHVNNGYEGEKNGPISDLSGQEHKYQFKEPEKSMSAEDPSTTPYKPGFLGKLLLSFSVYTNGAKILSTNQGSGTLTAVNGIRFISMSWVILGHTFAFGMNSAGNIATLFGALIKRKTFMAIINAEVSVDTFFALSIEQPSWGQQMPVAWVPLELQISEMKRLEINFIRKSELQKVNLENGDLALTDAHLIQLDILVEPKQYNGTERSTEFFLVPCMIKEEAPTSFVNMEEMGDKMICLSYRLKKSSVPAALIFKLIGSALNVLPIKEQDGHPCLYYQAAAFSIDDNNECRMHMKGSRIVVNLINKVSRLEISSDIAASLQECLTFTLTNVLQFYYACIGEDIKRVDILKLFDTEVGVLCCDGFCFITLNEAKNRKTWTCEKKEIHETHLHWILDETIGQDECPPKCEDFPVKDLSQSPNDKHLVRLASELNISHFNDFLLHLGLKTKDWEKIEYNWGRAEDAMVVALLQWKERNQNVTFQKILDAQESIADNRHHLCQVFKGQPGLLENTSFGFQDTPDDRFLSTLSRKLGNCVIQLGIELGLTFSDIEAVYVKHPKDFFSQMYEVLKIWKQKTPENTYLNLMLAIQRVRGKQFLKRNFCCAI